MIYIAMDTETTGMDAKRGDRIVEIGCVEMDGALPTGRVFHKFLNPGRPIPAEATAVHGITDAFVADKPRFAEVADEFLEFVGGTLIVIHNAPFDLGFLNVELTRCGKSLIKSDRVHDTLAMARQRWPSKQANLDTLCRRFEIDISHREKHGALLDAELLAQVYVRLKGFDSLRLEADLDEANEDRATDVPDGVVRKVRPRRAAVPVSPEAEALHREFLAGMPQPLWNHYLP